MTSGTLPLYLTGAFLTAFGASLVGTYAVRGWARRRGYVDHPDNERRVHALPTPNVGGVAVALAVLFTFVVWSFVIVPGQIARPDILAMLLGGVLILAVGFWDDTRHMSARTKFILQALVAAAVFLGGIQILGVDLAGLWQGRLPLVLSLLVTTVWIVGTTNAFNLIDGSDGVAAGAAFFAAISLAVLFAIQADPLGALMATALVGACLGFLFFNFPPASIFMGDCGSLFLGFTLASLAVITTQKTATAVAITIPVVALGIPLLDTLIAIIRRFLRHQPIFGADRGHIHHRLSNLGHSPRGVAMLLYVGFAGCASLSLVLAAPGRSTVVPVFVVAAVVLILAIQRLNIPELTELSRVFGRGLQQRAVISHNLRIYSVAEALSTARDGKALLAALDLALRGTEFSRLEIAVSPDLGRAFEGLEGVTRDASGYLLTLTFEHPLNPEHQVEIRLPLYDGDRLVGRISVFRTSEGERLYTDIRLLSRHLAPTLVASLRRIGSGRSDAGQLYAEG